MKDTQHHSESATLFSHFSHSIAGPKHRGDVAELLLMSILTCCTFSIEALEVKPKQNRTKIPNTSILKAYCENFIMFIEIAQFS